MAGRISEYATLAGVAAASGDLIEVLDVSDTSMAPTGTNKKMALGEVGNYFGIPRVAGTEYRVAALKGTTWVTSMQVEQINNRGHLCWLPGQGNKLASIQIVVGTAGDAAAKIRFGVYAVTSTVVAPTPNAVVGPLIVDCGQFDASTTGLKTATGLSIQIPPQGLWLAHVFQGAASTLPIIRCSEYNYGPGADVVGVQGSGDLRGGALTFTAGAGAFPSQPTDVGVQAGSLGWQTADWVVTFSA